MGEGAITSSPRPKWRTWPGPAMAVATYTTAAATGCAGPSTVRARSSLSTPFCSVSTSAPGARWGWIWRAAASVSVDFTHSSTTSAPATALASVLASRAHVFILRGGLQSQAVGLDRLHVGRAADERDGVRPARASSAPK